MTLFISQVKEYWPIYLILRGRDKWSAGFEPKLSLAHQLYVRLTGKAVEWLEPKFQDSIIHCGILSSAFYR